MKACLDERRPRRVAQGIFGGAVVALCLFASWGSAAQPATPRGSSPRTAQGSPSNPGDRKGSGELAKLKAPALPAYETPCRADGTILETAPQSELSAPTDEQLRTLALLRAEADAYTEDAADFDGKLGMIVRHYYEDRRQRILHQVDQEITVERQALLSARSETIARLEQFVQAYSGETADPQATPDAMFRLAALYEERARANFDAELSETLRPSMALYRRVLTEFPGYRELSAVLYYLGHAYVDAGRIDEAQQAFRSLVCSNRYQVLSAPGSEDAVILQSLVQDHDQGFWNEWYNKNPIPLDQRGARADQNKLGVPEEELTFRDPYAGCQALPQETLPGQEPRYVAEVWWQLGNYHFDQLDRRGGPYALNRAVSAYAGSLKFKQPPLYGVAMYKQAWALFKQQRYRDAIKWFVELLHYADEQERLTGDPGADFRVEAYTYIAGALTYVDLLGPPAGDPFIPRSDVLDLETDPLAAEEKIAVAIERVQDPALIPQEEPWTVEIYGALAREFIDLNQLRNAIATLELIARRFPLNRDTPGVVAQIADLYDELARLAPPGSAARTDSTEAALQARTTLSSYVGDTPWTQANKGDTEALLEAEQLVRLGLRRAAADHTNGARAYKDRAMQLSNPGQQRALLEQAISAYRLAAQGWGGVLAQDPLAGDAYESKFWLADANFWLAVLQVPLGRMPSGAEIEAALRAVAQVRDSNEDDRYEQPAAYYAVTLAEKVLDAKAALYEESNGVAGLPRRSEVGFVSEDGKRKPEQLSVPQDVLRAVCARDEYNARIPLDSDPQENGLLYATQAADYFFVYGQFDEARRRYIPIYEKYCGKNQWGYQAWERLVSMSNFLGDASQSRMLVESKSCAIDEETRLAEDAIRSPVRQGVAYFEARDLFEKAQKMRDGPEREQMWRKAAAAYRVALDAAPDRDEAPEAAMNGAFAYKQVGDYDKAIQLYSLFIEEYGVPAALAKLEQEDASRYEQRVQFLSKAHEALASAYVLFFDYPNAAETFDRIASVERFGVPDRKLAAKQALMLYVNLDDEAGIARARKRFVELGASEEERAESEFLIASGALKDWDPNSPDKGANQTARGRVITAMDGYYDRNKTWPPAARYVVQAAYHAARARRAGRSSNEDAWWTNTIAAFARYASVAPREGRRSTALGTREASMGAEAEYTLLDRQLKKAFDYETGHHRYKGTPVEVLTSYAADAKDAKRWYDQLQGIVDKYASQRFATVAIARQGSLYDSLRTGLYNTRPPELEMFTKEQERALRIAENSDNEALLDKADQIRMAVREAWRTKRDQELDGADRIVVDRYASAVMLAQRYNLSDPAVTRAIRRLAFMTDVIGEAKLSEYTSANSQVNYSPGMFQRMRPGVFVRPDLEQLPFPLPDDLPESSAGASAQALRAGHKAFRTGDLEGAKRHYLAAQKADPRAAGPPYALGAVLLRQGEVAAAQRAYERAVSLAPQAPRPLVALAQTLEAEGKYDAALARLSGKLGGVSQKAPLLAAMGSIESRRGRSAEAQKLAQRALKEAPDTREAMVVLAWDHYRARRIDLALYTLQGILDGFGEANPPRDAKNAQAHLLRGDIFASRELKGPAMEAYQAAIAARPDLVRAHLGLAAYMLEAGNAKDATPHLQMAVRYDRTAVAAHLMLGDAYRLLGRTREALAELTWVTQAAPDLAEPHYDLGLLLLMSDSVPSMTGLEAARRAEMHLSTYKSKAPRGGPDDVDELITRAKTKQAVLEANARQAAPAGADASQGGR